jgi:hypothetical protein
MMQLQFLFLVFSLLFLFRSDPSSFDARVPMRSFATSTYMTRTNSSTPWTRCFGC